MQIFLLIGVIVIQFQVLAICSFEHAMDGDFHVRKYHNARKLKSQYDHAALAPYQEVPLIPKRIHQIWIGGEVPQKFKALMQTWKDLHPTWEYYLWGDEDLKTFTFANAEAFYMATNMGTKSDLWRYEILEQFGGVYVDVDFECIKPLDELVHRHLFFTGIGGFDYINNAIIGSQAHHPILVKMVNALHGLSEQQLQNPWYHTGPLFFTRQVYHYLKEHPESGIVYPTRIFYPLPNTYRHRYWLGELSKAEILHFVIPETFAVHYWAESWVK